MASIKLTLIFFIQNGADEGRCGTLLASPRRRHLRPRLQHPLAAATPPSFSGLTRPLPAAARPSPRRLLPPRRRCPPPFPLPAASRAGQRSTRSSRRSSPREAGKGGVDEGGGAAAGWGRGRRGRAGVTAGGEGGPSPPPARPPSPAAALPSSSSLPHPLATAARPPSPPPPRPPLRRGPALRPPPPPPRPPSPAARGPSLQPAPPPRCRPALLPRPPTPPGKQRRRPHSAPPPCPPPPLSRRFSPALSPALLLPNSLFGEDSAVEYWRIGRWLGAAVYQFPACSTGTIGGQGGQRAGRTRKDQGQEEHYHGDNHRRRKANDPPALSLPMLLERHSEITTAYLRRPSTKLSQIKEEDHIGEIENDMFFFLFFFDPLMAGVCSDFVLSYSIKHNFMFHLYIVRS
ncbi:uncharacterized protein LOC144710096 [Wolffia australiana]